MIDVDPALVRLASEMQSFSVHNAQLEASRATLTQQIEEFTEQRSKVAQALRSRLHDNHDDLLRWVDITDELHVDPYYDFVVNNAVPAKRANIDDLITIASGVISPTS